MAVVAQILALLRRLSRFVFSITWGFIGPAVNRRLEAHKRKLFVTLPEHGTILEVGAGYGSNFGFFPPTSKEIVALEPNAFLLDGLRESARKAGIENLRVVVDDLETAQLAPASFDAVVCTLVLCSVHDARKAVANMHRVLKPGGRLYFLEHVHSSRNQLRSMLQNALTPAWKYMTDGCHLNRDSLKTITEAATWTKTEFKYIGENTPFVNFSAPYLVGVATK